MEHKSDCSPLDNDFFVAESELALKDEFSLPKAFTKVLLRRFYSLNADKHWNNEEFVHMYIQYIDGFSYVFILIRMSDKSLEDAGVVLCKDYPDYDVLRARLFESFLSAFREKYDCFPINIDGIRMIALGMDGVTEQVDSTYRDAMSGLELFISVKQEELRNVFGFIPQVIISAVKNNLMDMTELFQQTLFTIDCVFDIYPDKNVITYLTAIESVPDTSAVGPKPDFERFYFESIAAGDFSVANTLLHQRIREEAMNPLTALSLRIRVHSRMAWTLSYLGLPLNRGLLDCVAIYDCSDRLITCRTIEKALDCVDEFFSRLTAYYRKTTQSAEEKVDMVSDYIRENYMDATLSVGNICEIFAVAPSYFPRIFKSKTGIKLIDYIHLTRLARAKTLLEETSRSLEMIAKEVGYSGDWTLIRVFKRFENVTPGSVRGRRGKEQQNS